eukprot:gene21876-22861_t
MIELNNVSKWYGSFQVLTDCTTSVAKGDVVVVCGPSGSGKSTLIKTVNGLEPFQKGTITVDGVSVGDPKTNLSNAALWQKSFESMVLSVIQITDRVLPGMRSRGWGRIVTSTSSGVV